MPSLLIHIKSEYIESSLFPLIYSFLFPIMVFSFYNLVDVLLFLLDFLNYLFQFSLIVFVLIAPWFYLASLIYKALKL